ncbi:hypothetical protein [Salinimicrobium sediminis]|uniref:hypothetical protein n=1 Tax=Salinimicrobium sediminis TaxID=1343891 RepID=UPI0015CDD328|nr:hypothetical protein [Salinimicrobium sediminis]
MATITGIIKLLGVKYFRDLHFHSQFHNIFNMVTVDLFVMMVNMFNFFNRYSIDII